MSDLNSTPNEKPRKRRWPKWLLIVSLTFNLLILGLILGAQWGGHRDHGFNPRGPERGAIRDMGFGPLAGALSREDRREIGRELRKKSGSFKENRTQLEQEFDALLTALRSEPFDAAALGQVFERQAERLQDRGETLRGIVLGRIARMDIEERRAFADRIEKSVERRQRAGAEQ